MRRRPADKEEVAAGVQHSRAERLAGEQVVTDIDRIKCGVALPMRSQPALGSRLLAILLFRPVPRDDELRL